MNRMKKGIERGVADILLLLIIIVSIFPFVYMFLMSFKSTINAYNFDFSLDQLSLVQYQKIFSLEGFTKYIFNSFFVSFTGVILTVTVCSLAGYAFAKMNFKGNDRIFLMMILTMVVPFDVIMVPMFLITKNLGWLNTYQALIVPIPGAFGVFIMRQAILDVPVDLMDAAKIDGCGNLRTFFEVVLPLVKSSMLAMAIFTFVGAFNSYTWPLITCSRKEMKTLPLALTMMKTQFDSDVGLTMACAVINFLPPFIFYIFMQNKFKEGMTLSGVKG